MPQLTRADLHSEIDIRFPDNTTQLITPPIVRAFLHNFVDSALLAAADYTRAAIDALLATKADAAERRHTLAYAPTQVLDFQAGSVQFMEPTGPLTLTTASLALGRQVRLHFFNSSGAAIALAFPAWTWLGDVPTLLAAGKKATLALECAYGNTDSDIVAGYVAQH